MDEFIKREAAIAIIEEKQKELCPVGRYGRGYVYGSDREKYDAWDEIVDALENIPAADVAPVVHAQWEWFDEETGTPFTGYEREWGWRCSHCAEELPDDYDDPDDSPTFRFCYNCGAKMDGCDSDAKSV